MTQFNGVSPTTSIVPTVALWCNEFLPASVGEYAFELALCAHLESADDVIVSRQLGGAVVDADRRVLDVVIVEPGRTFDDRARLSEATIPRRILESPIGAGTFRDWRRALGDGIAAEKAIERAINIGVLEVDHDRGRELVRLVDRYPKDWFDRIIAIENKPYLDEPGALYEQLQFDVSLGLADSVVLVTESYVTRAHRNRFPDEIGIWRFDPEEVSIEVITEASELATDGPGIEIANRQTGRTEIDIVDTTSKQHARRHLAERAYGKGWRTYRLPPCGQVDPDRGPFPGGPYCSHFDRLIRQERDCGPRCPGFEPAAPPPVDLAGLRARCSPWIRNPPDRRSHQSSLERFTSSQ